MTRTISILGATGSVGRSAADVIRANRDLFRVKALVGGTNVGALAALAQDLRADFAVIHDEGSGSALGDALAGTGIRHGAGASAVLEAAGMEADIVLAAIVGAAGLLPTRAALVPGRRLALANKESLVCAGEAFMAEARRLGTAIMPVDSEHNALLQALGGGDVADVSVMTITASGGPFRTWTRDAIARATPAQAARHPTWSMGAKITVDSATLMNKGLELIEAHHLFGVEPDRLATIVHPQSIVHGLVQWRDGSVTMGCGEPDMRIPIAHALSDGRRLPMTRGRLDLAAIGAFTFEEPDRARFPCLALAESAMRQGGALPAVLNAANEIAVAAFLEGRIGFYGIPGLIETVMDRWLGRHASRAPASVEDALAMNDDARRLAESLLPAIAETATC